MKPLLFIFVLLLFSGGAISAIANLSQDKPLTFIPKAITLGTRPVKMHGNHLFLIETTVNNVPAKMLVDTGASHTSLDLTWAKKTFPSAKMRHMRGGDRKDIYMLPPQSLPIIAAKTFSIGENHFFDFLMPLTDLRGLQKALPELNDVVGILGMNTIAVAPCRVSFKNKTIEWLDRSRFEKNENKEKINARRLQGTDCFMLSVFSPKNAHPIDALLDCGAIATTVPEDFWTGARAEKRYAVVTTATGTKTKEITIGIPDDLMFSETFSLKNVSPQLSPASAPHKVLLGLDVLTQFDILFDHDNSTVFLIPE